MFIFRSRAVRLAALSFTVALWSAVTGVALAQAGGAIDTAFGTSGIAKNTSVTGAVSQVMGLPDGKVLAAGNCTTSFGSGVCLYRWTSTGAVDTSFGLGGVSFVLQNATEPRFVVRPDGRIVIAANSSDAIYVAQSNASGTAFDPNFAGGSYTTMLPPNTNGYIAVSLNDLALLPDGRLLVGGTCRTSGGGSSGFCMAQALENASLDTSFGVAPHNWSVTLPGAGDALERLNLLPDGRYVASGVCGAGQATRTVCVARFLSNGTFQHTYTIDVANRWERVRDARVVGSYITVAGSLNDFTGPTWNNVFLFAARREIYAVPGAVDTSFGGNYPTAGIAGGFNLDSSNDGDLAASMIADDGGMIYAGRCNAGTVLCLARLGPNGVLDTSFGVGGRYEYAGYSYPNAGASTTGVLGRGSKGQFYLGGSCAGNQPCVYRFNDVLAAAPRCTMDIDGDGRVGATTDGLILLRAMLGITGASAMSNATGAGATRTSWPQVQDYLFDQCQMPVR